MMKETEKDHGAGLIHQVASPIAETEPRLSQCQNCGQSAVLENWGGRHDSVSLARNQSLIQKWCRRCVVVAQIAFRRPLVESLPELERELAAIDKAEGR